MQPAWQANWKLGRPFPESCPSARVLRPNSGDGPDPASDDEEDEVFDPRFAELWEPGEFDSEEAEPEHGDFWPELDDDDD
jgi:hypothetical protein